MADLKKSVTVVGGVVGRGRASEAGWPPRGIMVNICASRAINRQSIGNQEEVSLFLISKNHPEPPNRVNLDSKSIQFTQISALGSLSPSAGSQRFPGIRKNSFCFNSCPILDVGWVWFSVQERFFSRVFRLTVSARAGKVFRLAR